jgi:hypothetical protein
VTTRYRFGYLNATIKTVKADRIIRIASRQDKQDIFPKSVYKQKGFLDFFRSIERHYVRKGLPFFAKQNALRRNSILKASFQKIEFLFKAL